MRSLSLSALAVGTWWLMAVSPAAQADVFRWDNGQLIPGTQGITPGPGVQLDHHELAYAELSKQNLTDSRFDSSNLSFASLFQSTLTNANLAGANLANASLVQATLTNANLTGAVVTGTAFYATTSRGFTEEQLYSTASYQQQNLQGISLWGNELGGWDFSGQNLAGAGLGASTLTNANLAGAVVTGTAFYATTSRGFTKEQLYSTASHQQKNLQGIDLSYNDLRGWEFNGQNFTNGSFQNATLTGADFSFADLRGSNSYGASLADTTSRNTILPDATIAGLDLAAGERLMVRDYAGSPSRGLSPNVVTLLGPMNIGATGQLDLGHSSLIVPGGNLALVTAQLARGFNSFAWNGPGINSLAAVADPSRLTALGVMLNDNGLGGPYYTTFAGQPVDAGSVLAKYTYYGDADLSGVVDGTDYALIDNGFNAVLSGWFNGDFDYSGLIDGTDYALIDNAFNSQGAPLGWGNAVAVPEPGTLALGAVGLVALVGVVRRAGRRQRNKRMQSASSFRTWLQMSSCASDVD